METAARQRAEAAKLQLGRQGGNYSDHLALVEVNVLFIMQLESMSTSPGSRMGITIAALQDVEAEV